MVETVDVASLPPAPKNPLPYWQRLKATREITVGQEKLRNAGGPVTKCILGPKWLIPPFVLVSSPQGARDALGRTDAFADRGQLPALKELRRLMGANLLDLPHDEWLPRRRALQPMFTKQHVPRFAGHMAGAAEMVSRSWGDGAEVDLDTECRKLTLRALGRSVLGLDLDKRADAMGPALRTALKWVLDRAVRPLNAPPLAADPGAAARPRSQHHPAPARRGDPIRRSSRSDEGCTTGARADGSDRPANGSAADRCRNLRRAGAVHARRP